jgi:hypothetical protein
MLKSNPKRALRVNQLLSLELTMIPCNCSCQGFAAVNNTVQSSTYVTIGSGSLGSPITIPAQSTFMLKFPFTLEYDTADPSGASMLALQDLFNSCGLFDPKTKKPITLKYNVGLSVRVKFDASHP